MELRVKTVNEKNKEKQKVKEIYFSAFPKEERMPFWMMVIMAKLWNTQFFSFNDDDTLCGFVYMATTRKLVFIMFFAVDESIRSQGYGSRISEKIQSMYPDHKIIVSIERCDAGAKDIEKRTKRRSFYLKNGYMETGYLIKLANVEQEILIKNGTFNKGEFAWFFIKYSNGIIYPKIWRVDS